MTEVSDRVRHKTHQHYGIGTVVEIIRPVIESMNPARAWVMFPGAGRVRVYIDDLLPEGPAMPPSRQDRHIVPTVA